MCESYIRANFGFPISLSGNYPALLLVVRMDKIIALTEASPSQSVNIDENQFARFMQKTPIWEYFKITQPKYLFYTKEEKERLSNDYYVGMQEGKSYLSCVCYGGFLNIL